MRIAWMIGVAVSVVDCRAADVTAPPNCGDVSVPAITVTVLDNRSDLPIQAPALVVVRDRAHVDTATGAEPGFPTYALAYDRPGTYSVSVAVPGYQIWQREPVVVNKGRCNVATIPLAAHLSP